MAAQRHVGPGIMKVRRPQPHSSRMAWLTRADDALWALLFKHADIISEGAADQEEHMLVYRGTTSIILPTAPLGLDFDASRIASLVRVASVDPHVRLRATRIARREAYVRAPGPLQPAHMDLVVRATPGGVRIDVEVEAAVEILAAGSDDTH